MNKKLIIGAALLTAIAVPANAAIFEYDFNAASGLFRGPHKASIDTSTNRITITPNAGASRPANLVINNAGVSNFNGVLSTLSAAGVVTGTIQYNGRTYIPRPGMPNTLIFNGKTVFTSRLTFASGNSWYKSGSTGGLSSTGGSTGGSTSSTSTGGSTSSTSTGGSTSSTSTGGSTSSSSSSSSSGSSSSGGSSSGGQVPAPGMLGLFGVSLLGLGLARRRRKKS